MKRLRFSELLAVLRKTLATVFNRLNRDLGAFPPYDLQFFVFKLVGCDEEFLKLLLNWLLRGRGRRDRPCSECESAGVAANRRSFRSAFPLLFCSIWRMPMIRQVSRTIKPGKSAASWITTEGSSGSPSSALVDGTKPQSWG